MTKFLTHVTLVALLAGTVLSAATNQTVGLFLYTSSSWPGYTLFAPNDSTNTYLIDNAGFLVHSWPSAYQTGQSVGLSPGERPPPSDGERT